MSAVLLKHLHVTFVAISLAGFFIRGIFMMKDSPLLQAKLTKILPHVIDTILLVSAISLAISLKFKPGDNPWIMAKIAALVIYIVLGTLAIKPIFAKKLRIAFWGSALVVYFYIISVAFTKSPAGFFGA